MISSVVDKYIEAIWTEVEKLRALGEVTMRRNYKGQGALTGVELFLDGKLKTIIRIDPPQRIVICHK